MNSHTENDLFLQPGIPRKQMAVLKINNKSFKIYDGLNVVGRKKEAAVIIKDLTISQNHAIITVVDENQHFVSDFDSSNGTKVNNIKLDPYILKKITDNTQICFGEIFGVYSFGTTQNEEEDASQCEMTQNFYGANTQILEGTIKSNSKTNAEPIDQEVTDFPIQVLNNSADDMENENQNHNSPTEISTVKPANVSVENNNLHEAETQILSETQRCEFFSKMDSNVSQKTDKGLIEFHEAETQIMQDVPATPVELSEQNTQILTVENNENVVTTSFDQINDTDIVEDTIVNDDGNSNDSYDFLQMESLKSTEPDEVKESQMVQRLTISGRNKPVIQDEEESDNEPHGGDNVITNLLSDTPVNSDAETDLEDDLRIDRDEWTSLKDLKESPRVQKQTIKGRKKPVIQDEEESNNEPQGGENVINNLQSDNLVNSDAETDVEDDLRIDKDGREQWTSLKGLEETQRIQKHTIKGRKKPVIQDEEESNNEPQGGENVINNLQSDNLVNSDAETDVEDDLRIDKDGREQCTSLKGLEETQRIQKHTIKGRKKPVIQDEEESNNEPQGGENVINNLRSDNLVNSDAETDVEDDLRIDKDGREQCTSLKGLEETQRIQKHTIKGRKKPVIQDEEESNNEPQGGENVINNLRSDNLVNSDAETDLEEDLIIVKDDREQWTSLKDLKEPPRVQKYTIKERTPVIQDEEERNNEPHDGENVINNLQSDNLVNSDAETDIEDDLSIDKRYNDDDVIPATQDANSSIPATQEPPQSNGRNKSNKNSEESFKLGLTELMDDSQIESQERRSSGRTISTTTQDFMNEVPNCAHSTQKGPLMGQQEKTPKLVVDDYDGPTQELPLLMNENSFYGAATQKLPYILNEPVAACSENEESIYVQATQKILADDADFPKPDASTRKLPLSSSETQIAESVYFAATQKLPDDNIESQLELNFPSQNLVLPKIMETRPSNPLITVLDHQENNAEKLTINESESPNEYHFAPTQPIDEQIELQAAVDETTSLEQSIIKVGVDVKGKKKFNFAKKNLASGSNVLEVGNKNKPARRRSYVPTVNVTSEITIIEPTISKGKSLKRKSPGGKVVSDSEFEETPSKRSKRASVKEANQPEEIKPERRSKRAALRSKLPIGEEKQEEKVGATRKSARKNIEDSTGVAENDDVFIEEVPKVVSTYNRKKKVTENNNEEIVLRSTEGKRHREKTEVVQASKDDAVPKNLPNKRGRKSRKQLEVGEIQNDVPNNEDKSQESHNPELVVDMYIEDKSDKSNRRTNKTAAKPKKIVESTSEVTSNRQKIKTAPDENIKNEEKPSTSGIKTKKSRNVTASVELDLDDFKKPENLVGRRKRGVSVASSSSSNESDVSNTTPKKSRRTIASISDSVLTSPERTKRTLKPKVVFTMMDSPELESVIRQLGGSVVDSVDACTVLVTKQVKRSQKLLTAVGQGKPICSPDWLIACKKAYTFLDPWEFLLKDKEAEKKWDFSLAESLNRSSNQKLLQNYTFLLVVNNAADVLKGAIEACGGKSLTKAPKNCENFVVVSTKENKSKYSKYKKQNGELLVIEAEAIFDGVLRQEIRFHNHVLN